MDSSPKLDKRNLLLKTDRLETFTDGVFAIAITLLILEVKIPKDADLEAMGGLYAYLLHIWPAYLSYFISFIVIGVYWSNVHWLFTFVIKRTNHVFNLLCLLFLMTIAFIPFTTAIMSDYILSPEYRSAAVTTYCIGYMLPIPMSLIGALYAFRKHRLVDPRLSKKFLNRQIIKFSSGMVILLLAIGLSFQYPWAALGIVFVDVIIYLLPPDVPVYTDAGVERSDAK
jgi:uncharacterized membrane protein